MIYLWLIVGLVGLLYLNVIFFHKWVDAKLFPQTFCLKICGTYKKMYITKASSFI